MMLLLALALALALAVCLFFRKPLFALLFCGDLNLFLSSDLVLLYFLPFLSSCLLLLNFSVVSFFFFVHAGQDAGDRHRGLVAG